MNGLVLEGGGLRGLFTAGVLDVWMEHHLAFDGLIGVSAGACFGCNWKSRQPGRVIRYNLRFARDPRYCSLRSLLSTGDLFNADFCYRALPDELDPFDGAAFAADPTAFFCVATDCETARPVYRRCDRADRETLDWIRASASMPLVARPVEINGRRYLDGGISDAIPLAYFESIGYDRNVVITTRPADYRKVPNAGIRLFKPFLRHEPAVYSALLDRHIRYNSTMDLIAERVRQGRVLVISPDVALPIGRVCHAPERMRCVYALGRTAGEKALDRLGQFLNAKGNGR